MEEVKDPKQPHGALFFVLPYLDLLELITMSEVCPSLREAVDNDSSLWQHILVKGPLNFRINDDILLKITSKALGRLRTLSLMNCSNITDDGLQRVLEKNPQIIKLCVPSCTKLTADGIVRAIKKLTEKNQNLKSIRLKGIAGITKDHLQALHSCLQITNPKGQKPNMYLGNDHPNFSRSEHINRPMDLEVCPKCHNVTTVFDCPRESCRKKGEEAPLRACKGCSFCIPRCEECGGCIEEQFESCICSHYLCLHCWLQLRKCNMCNRPYCNWYGCRKEIREASSNGFICEDCEKGCSEGEDF